MTNIMAEIIPIKRIPFPMESPFLHISIEDALKISPLLESVAMSADAGRKQIIAARLGDAGSFGVQIADVISASGGFLVKFTKESTQLLGAGELQLMKDASGRLLPHLIDGSGKIVETARAAKTAAQVTGIAANLLSAVVTVAHVVSGADLSKKLDQAGKRINFLVVARRIDQLSRLEAIFRQAKQLSHLGITESARQEMQEMGRDLFELRAAWRREIIHSLDQIENPKEGNRVTAWFHRRTRRSKDRKTVQEISDSEVEIGLMDVSLAMHIALAQTIGSLDSFLAISLLDELNSLSAVKGLLWDKRALIHKEHPDLRSRVIETIASLQTIDKRYSAFVLPRFLPDIVI